MDLNRRELLGTLGAAVVATGFTPSRVRIKPPRVRPGDVVGIVTPATAAFETEGIDIKMEGLEALGLRPRLGSHVDARHGYFAGTDEERAADLNQMFADPAVAMIVAKGGWGSARLLPHLDYERIAASPKVLLGFSDVTVLLNAIHARTGLVTFHGPSPRRRLSADYFRRVVMAGEVITMENPREIDEGDLAQMEHRIRTITPGRAEGRLLGGNLTVLAAIMGSDYLPDWRDTILFLEDTNEKIYRVDRMLTQLRLAGVLGQIGGFVFGRCTRCLPGEGYGSLTLDQVLAEHIEPLGIPAWRGAMIGHLKNQFTMPLGIRVEIDAGAGSIRMLEAAVV